MKLFALLLSMVCGLYASIPTSPYSSGRATPVRTGGPTVPLNQEAIDWIKSNYQAVHGKTFNVFINDQGDVLETPETLTVNSTVDYMRLLASDLVSVQSTNKLMLLEGFVLYAIIQGEVFPVSPIPATEKERPLMLNAAKLAAYAMTYRMGNTQYGQGHLERHHGGIGGWVSARGTMKPGEGSPYKNKTTTPDNSDDEEEEIDFSYSGGIGRLLVQELLKPDSGQARALRDAYNILQSSTKDKLPSQDDIYWKMYERVTQPAVDHVKRVRVVNSSLTTPLEGEDTDIKVGTLMIHTHSGLPVLMNDIKESIKNNKDKNKADEIIDALLQKIGITKASDQGGNSVSRNLFS